MTVRDSLRRLVPTAIRRSYLAKLTIALLLVVVVVAGVGVNAYFQTDAQLDQSVEGDSLDVARLEAERIADWNDRNVRTVRMLSKYQDLQHEEPRAVELFLQREAWFLPESVRAVHVVDANTSAVVASTAAWRTLEDSTFDEEAAPWARQRLGFDASTQVYTSPAYTSLGEPVVAYITPVPRRPEQLLVLVATVPSFDSDDRTELRRMAQLVDANGLVFYDGFGHAVPHPLDGARNDTTPGTITAVLAAAQNGSTGFLGPGEAHPPLPTDHVVAYAPVHGTDWTVLVYTPTTDAYAISRSVTMHLLATTVAALVGLLLIAATIGRNTVRSLKQLARKAERLEQGDLDVDLSTDRVDEFGELSAAFDNMQTSLRQQIEAAERARMDAEAAADDLAASNETLAEQREMILVLHRLLRHNLRNDLNAITWNAQALEDADLDATEAGALRALIETAERLAENTRKAQQIEAIAESDERDVHDVDLVSAVEHAVTAMRAEHPDATIRMDLPEHAFVRSLLAVQSVVEYLIDNAVVHNDRPRPTVEVSVIPAGGPDDMVELRVADDGPGIPQAEIEPILEGREQPLRHGSGIGLWIAVWVVRNSGGNVSFEERSPRGTVVVVELEPAASELGDTGSGSPRSELVGE
ncbi:sensor histidine kinase [Haloarchaeobius sp. DT45]|uniref:sensor histidine kinase n=1 Tax=Haloarchaeobius sp. DT45 TaxID=3446116 RepID=UPI003F6A716D